MYLCTLYIQVYIRIKMKENENKFESVRFFSPLNFWLHREVHVSMPFRCSVRNYEWITFA